MDVMSLNAVKQVIIILSRRGLCFNMVEAKRNIR